MAGIGLVLSGAASGTFDLLGATLALGSAIVYTCYILVGDRVAADVPPGALAALVCTGAFGTFLVSTAVRGGPDLGFSPAGWAWIGLLVLVSTVGAILLFFAGLGKSRSDSGICAVHRGAGGDRGRRRAGVRRVVERNSGGGRGARPGRCTRRAVAPPNSGTLGACKNQPLLTGDTTTAGPGESTGDSVRGETTETDNFAPLGDSADRDLAVRQTGPRGPLGRGQRGRVREGCLQVGVERRGGCLEHVCAGPDGQVPDGRDQFRGHGTSPRTGTPRRSRRAGRHAASPARRGGRPRARA